MAVGPECAKSSVLSSKLGSAVRMLVSRYDIGDIAHIAMSFESNLNRLEQIVSQLDSDKLDLNSSLKLFEEGIELLRKASIELNETESKVKELVERADGVLELRDLA